MTERSNVVVLKVHRNSVGKQFAFDKLYLFNREDRELIPKIFQYAVVMPIDEDVIHNISTLVPKKVTHHKWHRDDAEKEVETKLDGRSTKKSDIKQWWQDNVFDKYDIADRVAVVPVLTSRVRNKLRPRYLASKRWFKNPKRSRVYYSSYTPTPADRAISELAYLATPNAPPNDKIRPLCAMCPRIMHHLQGSCLPGQDICYTSLNLLDIIEEPESGRVQPDDNRDNRHTAV